MTKFEIISLIVEAVVLIGVWTNTVINIRKR